MNNALAHELSRYFDSGASLDPELKDIPPEFHQKYVVGKRFNEQFDWSVRGEVVLVIDGQLDNEPINIKDTTQIRECKMRVVVRDGRQGLIRTAMVDGLGEIYPHGSGRYFPSPKIK